MKIVFAFVFSVLLVACKTANGSQPMEIAEEKQPVAYFPETHIPEDSLDSRFYSLEEFRAFVKGKKYTDKALYDCYDREGVRNYVHPLPDHPLSKDKINILSLSMGMSSHIFTFNDSTVNIDIDYNYPYLEKSYSKRYRFDAGTQLLYGTDLHYRFGSKVIVPRLLYIDDTYIILRFEDIYHKNIQSEAEYSITVLKRL